MKAMIHPMCRILNRFLYQLQLFDPVFHQFVLDLKRFVHIMIIRISDKHFLYIAQ